MKIIAPHIACICFEDEFESVVNSYSTIYIITSDGFLKHQNLVGGRSVRLSIPKIPDEYLKPVTKIEQELDFLPEGKIPVSILNQITKFFQEVIKVKKSDYEAHCFVLWTKEKGYHVSVPKQTVSKAAVSFSYDTTTLPLGSIIVLDMHSHNTMGSFFSGTDNNNDKNCIYYSGVIGNLDKTPTMVFRFNFREINYAVEMSEIFEMPTAETVEIDSAWLDQITIPETTDWTRPMNYQNQAIRPFYDTENSRLYPATYAEYMGYIDPDVDEITGPLDFGDAAKKEATSLSAFGDDEYEYILGDAIDFIMENRENDDNLKIIIDEAFSNLTDSGRRYYETNGFK